MVVTLKPYLVRAVYEWCVAQGFTPMLTTRNEGASRLPRSLMAEETVTLNISPQAVVDLNISDDEVAFQARFQGVAHRVILPMQNVLSIFSREQAVGINFEHMQSIVAAMNSAEEQPNREVPPTSPISPPASSGRPHLSLVK